MAFPKILSCLLMSALCSSSLAQYASDYDSSDGYRAEPEYEERASYRDDVPAASVERATPAFAPAFRPAPGFASPAPVYSPPAPAFAPAYAPVFPSSDTSSYHLYHRDHPQNQVELIDEAPLSDHKHHSHDHGTSSMSFYQKIKHHDYKFKLEQKHGKKHGSFHGLAHPYAYGGLKVHDF